MTVLRIGICDDLADARLVLRSMLERILERQKVQAQFFEFSAGETLLRWYENHAGELDVLFLDMELHEMDGMETARRLREADAGLQLVFVTGYSDYVFDGKYEKGIPIYETNDGNDIVTYFDLTSITKDYMDIINLDRDKVERYIRQLDSSRCPIGVYCESKKTTKCAYLKMCWDILPEKNSILTYLDNHHGFKDGNIKYNVYDLINEGMTSMLDVPDDYLNRKKNVIQKQVVKTHTPYFNKSKIIDGIKQINYPINHLDFVLI